MTRLSIYVQFYSYDWTDRRALLKRRSSQIVCTFHVLGRARTTIPDGRRRHDCSTYYESCASRVCDDPACVGDAPSSPIVSAQVDGGRGSHEESATAYGYDHEIGECPSVGREREARRFLTDVACRVDVRRVSSSAADLCQFSHY